MSIGPLADGESAPVIALWDACGLTRPWNDAGADLQRALDGSSSTVLLARDDAGALVGSVMVGHDGHRGWLYYLAVAPKAQRGGIGGALVAAAEAWLVERGVPKVNVMVRGDNAVAGGFYDAIGYAQDDVVVRSRRLI